MNYQLSIEGSANNPSSLVLIGLDLSLVTGAQVIVRSGHGPCVSIKSSADIDRPLLSCAVLDLKDDSDPIPINNYGLDKGLIFVNDTDNVVCR